MGMLDSVVPKSGRPTMLGPPRARVGEGLEPRSKRRNLSGPRSFSLWLKAVVPQLFFGVLQLFGKPALAEPVPASLPTRRSAPAPEAPMPSSAPDEYPVDFSAGRVEVDVRLNELELADDVVVVVDRYRLTADRIKLSRSERGVIVDGDGRVAFCRCPNPPVSIGFSKATVAPPTDLLVENPTLRVVGVPVLWLPYLWLRAPDRAGLLPPRVAYSSEDGLLAGAGVHLPFDHGTSFVDLEAAGYFAGGIDGRLRLATPSNRLRLRYDELGARMLAIEGRGVLHSPGLSTAAYRIDAMRGPRALVATPLVTDAAQRYDTARAELGRHHGRLFYGVGASYTARRGGDFDETGAWGPEASLGLGDALWGLGDAELLGLLRTSDSAELGALTSVEERGVARFHARPGPFSAELELFGAAGATSQQSGADHFLRLGGRGEFGLPLRRRFGTGDPLLHYVSPLVSVAGYRPLSRAELLQGAEQDRELGALSAGVRSSLGRWAARSAIELEARAGWVGGANRISRLAGGRLLAQSEYFASSSEAVIDADHREHWLASTRVRLGPELDHHVTVYAEGQGQIDAMAARFLLGDPFNEQPRLAWYDSSGLSSGAELMLRWSRSVSTAVAADFDVERELLVGARGSLAYRHPCGCLATVAWAGHRIGREGVDAWLTVDLIP